MWRVVLACVTLSSVHQSKQWVMGQRVKWVSFLDGSYGWWVDALSPMTHLHTRLSLCHVKLPLMFLIHFIGGNSTNNLILYCLIAQEELLVIPVSSAECERHFSAFNARHIITPQRNLLFLKLWRLCQLC